jgi:hypothetical protein
MPTHDHSGIACSLDTKPVCCAIEQVLAAIILRFPDDFARLTTRVLGFRDLSSGAADDSRGRWLTDDAGPVPNRESQGFVELSPCDRAVVALVAHELGHAVATDDDVEQRATIDSEWAEEMTADYYAHKWGFGAAIEASRRERCWLHHGPAPSSEFEVNLEDPARVLRYRVTRDFRFELVSTQEG